MPAIAAALGVPILSVVHGVEGMKSRHENPPRACLNVSLAARDWFQSRQFPGEAMWQTVNRVLGIS
jgi:hypothetical protein